MLTLLMWSLWAKALQVTPGPVSEWEQYKARFIAPEGRSIDALHGGRTTSEGQGYAMLLAEAYNDRIVFERLWSWTQANLTQDGEAMLRWRWIPNAPVQERMHATDGDILIGWALLRGAKRWSNQDYLAAAKARMVAIQHPDLFRQADGITYWLPAKYAFERDDGSIIVNPSYFVFPAFLAFRDVELHGAWGLQIDTGLRLLERARFGAYQLPPDWVHIRANGSMTAVRDNGQPDGARHGYDAVRVPLHLLWANFGDPKLLKPFRLMWAAERTDPKVPVEVSLTDDRVLTKSLGTGFRAIERAVDCAVT
ncbi:MAG TPA: endoglucanase, partial [Alphaproteobacteria bacterium]|nr:endoglucanase [Alphaproteobacteria bacterium]